MRPLHIGNRSIAKSRPTYIIAEMSANHHQSIDEAIRILHSAKEAGADAVKLQTYTPDTMTIPSEQENFRIGGGTLWDGGFLFDLYQEACMPWEWFPKLKTMAAELGMDIFSTAFDSSAVDFLEEMEVPCHKVASFEIVDIALIRKMAATGKPLLLSTGMATLGEIAEAVQCARDTGAEQIALLKCNSAYPAPPEEMNLRTIPHLAEAFQVPVGLSDHTLGIAVPVAAVALGACIVEKHFTLSRSRPGPDSVFSLEPHEFRAMVEAIRTTEKALGGVRYGVTAGEAKSRIFRRSLFVVRDMEENEAFTPENLRSIRPGEGLHPRYLAMVLGRRASQKIKNGTPLAWHHVTRS